MYARRPRISTPYNGNNRCDRVPPPAGAAPPVDVRAAVAPCIMRAVRRQVQRDALAGQAVERGQLSAASLGAFAALIVLGAVPYAARSDWSLGAEAALRHDNNVGNAQSASDIIGDSTLDARLSIFQLFPLGDGYSLTVGGDLGGEVF